MGDSGRTRRAWGEPLWSVDVAVSEATLPERVEIAIVGAGFTGLAAAIVLARAGAEVHVLEASTLGDGASGRSGGLALEGTAFGPLPGVERCLDALREQVRRHGIACDLALDGCWEVRHAAPGETPGPGRSWPDAGSAPLVVDAAVSGGSLDPGALVAGLAAAALEAGAALHERTRVERCEAGSPHLLYTGGRRVEAGRVFLAVDALPPALAPVPGVRPALTLALATEPLPDALLDEIGLGRTPFYTVDMPYLWGRATPDGRLVIGAGLAFDADGDLERVSLARDDVRESFARLEPRVRGLHPALARVELTHRWGGPISFRQRAPVLAELAPGLVAAGAYAGHGVALSLRSAELAAARLLGGAALPEWGSLGPTVEEGAAAARP
jgi:glycine/D-amino acid oxidase-like deaminating enzyme